MDNPKYLYKSEEFLKVFEFVSEGPKGSIKKIVQYTETGTKNVYNLAFGDFDEKINGINDLVVTNNGDSLKVLATVASTVYAFLEKYPDAWIFATGSTAVRTRLYRMGITNNLVEIKEDFDVFGFNRDGKWEDFIGRAMNIKQLNESKVPIIVFDKKLEKYRDKVLFPEKLEKANRILEQAGLPKKK